MKCVDNLGKNSMKLLPEELKNLSIHGTEMYHLLFRDEDENKRRMFMKKDVVSFRLPQSLQPGYDANNFSYEIEDQDSPMLPLLRCLGTGKTIQLLGALLCEVRIILVSKYVDTLSSCVRAAMALLSQGLLVWRHVSISVLPPHLFRFLSAGAPYIVGVLDQYINKVEEIRGLKDVLSINLDTGYMKVYNMDDPKQTMPDLMESAKGARRQKNKYMGIEMLAKDVNEVIEADKKLWTPPPVAFELPDAAVIINNHKKSSQMNLGKVALDKEVISENDHFFGAAELFVKSMKVSSNATDEKETTLLVATMTNKTGTKELVRTDMAARPVTKRPFTVCNNEQGEEIMRASLVCFFLELYGDIGMYLLSASKTTGRGLKIDKKKFLLRKMQMGVVDQSPMWHVLKTFSRLVMFERFVYGCIENAERRKKSKTLLDHVPIFSLCQKHLRKKKSEFTTMDIRRVVFTTMEGCPAHKFIERTENVRELALALTSDKAFEGNEVGDIKQLMQSCKECSSSFNQVVAVCWMRVGETRSNYWKHVLLGLNLFKTLVLHGPITAISAVTDGVADIYALRFYVNKSVEAEKFIQMSARQLYYLINHIALTIGRRRKALANDVLNQQSADESAVWSNYLIRRLPLDIGFKEIHNMFSPSESAIPRIIVKENNPIIDPNVETINRNRRSTNKIDEQLHGPALKIVPNRRPSIRNLPSNMQGDTTTENKPQDHNRQEKNQYRSSPHRPDTTSTRSNLSNRMVNSEVASFGVQRGIEHNTEHSYRRDSSRSGEVPDRNSREEKRILSPNGNMNYDRHQGGSRILQDNRAIDRHQGGSRILQDNRAIDRDQGGNTILQDNRAIDRDQGGNTILQDNRAIIQKAVDSNGQRRNLSLEASNSSQRRNSIREASTSATSGTRSNKLIAKNKGPSRNSRIPSDNDLQHMRF